MIPTIHKYIKHIVKAVFIIKHKCKQLVNFAQTKKIRMNQLIGGLFFINIVFALLVVFTSFHNARVSAAIYNEKIKLQDKQMNYAMLKASYGSMVANGLIYNQAIKKWKMHSPSDKEIKSLFIDNNYAHR